MLNLRREVATVIRQSNIFLQPCTSNNYIVHTLQGFLRAGRDRQHPEAVHVPLADPVLRVRLRDEGAAEPGEAPEAAPEEGEGGARHAHQPSRGLHQAGRGPGANGVQDAARGRHGGGHVPAAVHRAGRQFNGILLLLY